MWRLLLGLSCVLALASHGRSDDAGSAPAIDYATARKFQQMLDNPFAVTWEAVTLRTAAERMATARGVSLLLDRRLDPSQELSLSWEGSLRELLSNLLPPDEARPSLLENVVYLGPVETAAKLRTVCALRWGELVDDEKQSGRLLKLSRRETVKWDDLDRPVEIVKRLCGQYQVTVENIERVPHDLWAGTVLPQVTFVDALSLVLAQFDLGFEWGKDFQSIRLVDLPEQISIERLHDPQKGNSPAASAEHWREAIAGITAVPQGNKVRVIGTLEQHEQIEQLRRPRSTGSSTTAATKGTGRADNLRLKRYTLNIRNKSIRDLMESLAKAPDLRLEFDYDAQTLGAAGVDLDRRVTFEVKEAAVEELLRKGFESLDVTWTLEGRKVRLKPKLE